MLFIVFKSEVLDTASIFLPRIFDEWLGNIDTVKLDIFVPHALVIGHLVIKVLQSLDIFRLAVFVQESILPSPGNILLLLRYIQIVGGMIHYLAGLALVSQYLEPRIVAEYRTYARSTMHGVHVFEFVIFVLRKMQPVIIHMSMTGEDSLYMNVV